MDLLFSIGLYEEPRGARGGHPEETAHIRGVRVRAVPTKLVNIQYSTCVPIHEVFLCAHQIWQIMNGDNKPK